VNAAECANISAVDLVAAWNELGGAWRRTFELAWEAHGRGTIPVGAVIAAPDGEIVAEGRNRIFEDRAPAGELAGTRLAHAEVNALAHLDLSRRWEDHTLYTSLEPCVLCVGAALLSTIGGIRYASVDVVGGGFTTRSLSLDRKHGPPVEREGPLGGPLALFSESLLAAFFVRNLPESPPFGTLRSQRPQVVELGAELDRRGSEDAARADVPLGEFLPRIADLF
jgi:tRNA(Arg) A34 adenosine deaminase TadA